MRSHVVVGTFSPTDLVARARSGQPIRTVVGDPVPVEADVQGLRIGRWWQYCAAYRVCTCVGRRRGPAAWI